MPNRLRFDPKRPLVAARDFTFAGKDYKAGDPFTPEGVPDRMLQRQYETRAVLHGEDDGTATDTDPVSMTGPSGGRYTITAPWLDEPVIVRGKTNAEKRLAQMRADGPPEPDSPANDTAKAGQGAGATQESDVENQNKPKPEDGDKPNEPGTNQPNGAEVINDHKVAEGDGGGTDGKSGPVGP